MRKATDQRHAQTIWWDAVMWLVVRWRGVSYCGWLRRGMSCHVMSFDVVVTSFDAMWLLVLRHVTWCIDELLTIVPRNRMKCYELKMPLVVRSRRVVQGVTMWWSKELLCTTPVLLCITKYYSSTTLYYTVLRQYYSVLPSTTKYYSVLQSTTPVLLCTTEYYKVLLCTTKYYASTTTYYKVLLCTTKYYSSTTLYYPVLQRTTQYYNVLLQYYSE